LEASQHFSFYRVGLLAPRQTPILEDQASVFISPRGRVATHFSRLLRHALVTVGLFLFPGHHTVTFLILALRLRLGLSSGLFPSCFHTKLLYECLIFPMRITCAVRVILLDFMTLIIFDELYKLWSSSLCSLLQPPATSSHLLGPNILLSTLFSS
jgi:hypothetical protein